MAPEGGVTWGGNYIDRSVPTPFSRGSLRGSLGWSSTKMDFIPWNWPEFSNCFKFGQSRKTWFCLHLQKNYSTFALGQTGRTGTLYTCEMKPALSAERRVSAKQSKAIRSDGPTLHFGNSFRDEAVSLLGLRARQSQPHFVGRFLWENKGHLIEIRIKESDGKPHRKRILSPNCETRRRD